MDLVGNVKRLDLSIEFLVSATFTAFLWTMMSPNCGMLIRLNLLVFKPSSFPAGNAAQWPDLYVPRSAALPGHKASFLAPKCKFTKFTILSNSSQTYRNG